MYWTCAITLSNLVKWCGHGQIATVNTAFAEVLVRAGEQLYWRPDWNCARFKVARTTNYTWTSKQRMNLRYFLKAISRTSQVRFNNYLHMYSNLVEITVYQNTMEHGASNSLKGVMWSRSRGAGKDFRFMFVE